MRCGLLLTGLLLLTGCATGPASLPTHMTPPASECRWALPGGSDAEHMRRVVEALEAEGYTIRHTDAELGLVSAERSRILPGYGSTYNDPWPRTGVYGSYGIGRRGGIGIGFGTGISFGGGSYRFAPDATRIDQVSVVAPGDWVQVSADTRILDHDGVLRESRSGSGAEFCAALRRSIERQSPEESGQS